MGGEGSLSDNTEPPLHPKYFAQPIYIGSHYGQHPKQGPKVYHTGLNMYADSVDDFLSYWVKPEVGSETFNLWVLHLYLRESSKYHKPGILLKGPYSFYPQGKNSPDINLNRAYLLIDKWYPGLQVRRDLIKRFQNKIYSAFVPTWWKRHVTQPTIGKCTLCLKEDYKTYNKTCNVCGWAKEGHTTAVITS
jgi:ribosomal protein L37E